MSLSRATVCSLWPCIGGGPAMGSEELTGRAAVATNPAGGSTTTQQPSSGIQDHINDGGFIRALCRLKELRSFLIQEAIHIDHDDSSTISFGRLNLLQYSPQGR